ncbi:olfactory receptor 10AG1-like [Trichosurus vulpecula]|uniref:olfactory receptor 10AG1-like n=1 Tax=Trichosurus vulpecula TaxID=9337 RepID=UPI00186AED91|nr:olfactory receptor 10AG1-like [Trichosurus vulpecula]
MAEGNISLIMEFMLLGFSDLPNLQGFLFGLFLIIYTGVLIGNGLIIVITKVEPVLQTPMYFFLRNFSFLEICYTSVILPRILVNLRTQKINISFTACAAQFCAFFVMAITENFLLTVMAYDRYVAICKPLTYPLIMNHKVCVCLVAGSWISGIPFYTLLTYLIFSLPFCGSNRLDHIFCDIRPLLKLACGDTSVNEFSFYFIVMIVGVLPFLLIIWSYVKIITAILKVPGTKGRSKAFSTCSSHLIIVLLYLGCGIITYLRPSSSHSVELDKVFSIMYTTVTPVFNPIIYSLRNKDVVFALKKLLFK